MTSPAKVIPDLDFIPTAWAVTRNGRADHLSPSEHALIVLLQKGPATYAECLKASNLSTPQSLHTVVSDLRKKLKPMGVSISKANRLPGYFALIRVLS